MISTSKVIDSVEKTRVDMRIRIDKGQKVKIKKIAFYGNEKMSSKRLRKAMKNTKQKNLIRVHKRSKYIEADYEEDLVSVVNKLKEKGFRDARIVSDSLVVNDDKTWS